jgi:hypothetical protein
MARVTVIQLHREGQALQLAVSQPIGQVLVELAEAREDEEAAHFEGPDGLPLALPYDALPYVVGMWEKEATIAPRGFQVARPRPDGRN